MKLFSKLSQIRVLFKKFKSMEILQLGIYAITITGFLIGLDFFCKKSSLDIEIPDHLQMVRVYQKDLYQFYVDNGFKIPEKLNSVIQYHHKEERGTGENIISSSHKTFLEFLRLEKSKREETYGIDDIAILISNWGIKDIESRLNNFTADKQHSRAYILSSFFMWEDISDLSVNYRKELTSEEYYIFLIAIMRSRIIEHTVIIENEGDFDLKDIRLAIPSPYSEITETRNGNIVNLEAETYQPLYTYELKSDSLAIKIPKLAKGERMFAKIYTRENKLNKDEISYDYTPVKTIDRKQSIIWFVVILILLFSLCSFLKFKLE